MCYNLNIESCANEAFCLRGFSDGDVMEVSVKRSRGVRALDFLDFSTSLAFFSIAAVASFKALAVALVASLSALSASFLASLVLWLRILFLSFSRTNERSTLFSSSGTSIWSDPSSTPLESALSHEIFSSFRANGLPTLNWANDLPTFNVPATHIEMWN
jgi:hypothetical protein